MLRKSWLLGSAALLLLGLILVGALVLQAADQSEP